MKLGTTEGVISGPEIAYQEVQAMSRKRRSLGAPPKAKAALAAAGGDKTTAQLASKFGVHANQISSWKRQLLQGAAELFEDRRGKRNRERLADEQQLYEQDQRYASVPAA